MRSSPVPNVRTTTEYSIAAVTLLRLRIDSRTIGVETT